MSRQSPVREAKIEQEFYRLLMNVLEDHKYTIEKVSFGPVEPEYRVDGGRADLMVPAPQGSPLLIIETKRKVQSGSGVTVFREFDPMSPRVITQALTYATLTGSSLFATTNGKVFALFLVPERGEPFRIDRHRLYIKEIQLKKEIAEEILNLVARWKSGLKIEKTPVDWAFILRLRSFVSYLAHKLVPLVKQVTKANKAFLDRLVKESGEVSEEDYAREAAYILMNKIIFHKILERYYGKLTKLHPMYKKSGKAYMAGLKERFVEAEVVTKDFEPVFSAGVYDECPLPDDEMVLDEINAFIDDMDTYKLEDIGSDVVGFIYERLIPPEERHKLGQFYTPPYVAELISKWAIRTADDKILDPACGSGTFLVKAYSLLKAMKPLAGSVHHAELLEQLYGIDVNPFPAHLTAVNLAMRDVSHPTSQMNVIVEDFFNIKPDHILLSPFAIKTARGELRKETSIPHVDAIVANPPYTRWLEVTDQTKKAVDGVIGDTLREYSLQARIRAGVETGIFMPFVVHGRNFLKEGGRLAMIISNSWLQTDVGINFTKYLLDNFKVHAVIDFATRVFDLPLVATTVILLEKCSTPADRDENKTTLLYVDTETKVEELLRAIKDPAKYTNRFTIATERQGGIPRDQKLVNLMFGLGKLEKTFEGMSKVEDFFNVTRGNIGYAAEKSRGLGSNEFFYIPQGTVDQWGLKEYVVPVVTSPRYTRFFSYDHKDWEQMRKKGTPAYVFVCNEARSKLPTSVREYVEWGESECKVWYDEKNFSVCSQTQACKEREADRTKYAGWYDVGRMGKAHVFTSRYAQYSRRFVLGNFGVALDDDFIALALKEKMTEDQLKALLAFLNSSFGQFQIEQKGRATGGGMVSLEVDYAKSLRIPDVTKLGARDLKRLVTLYDELEAEARRVGGADKRVNLELMRATLERLDEGVALSVQLPKSVPKALRKNISLMMERRVQRAEGAKPESVTGEEAVRIRPPKTRAKEKKQDIGATQLDRWAT